MTKLKFLDLSNNNISEIKGLNNLVNLEELNLSGNKIMELKGLESHNNLRKLKCKNCGERILKDEIVKSNLT